MSHGQLLSLAAPSALVQSRHPLVDLALVVTTGTFGVYLVGTPCWHFLLVPTSGRDNIAFREEYELVDLSARTARLVAQQLLLLLADNNNKNNNNIVLKVDLRKVDRWCKRNPHFDTRSINRQVYCYFWPLSLNPNDPSCTSAVVDEFIDQAQRRAQIDACLMLFPLYGIARSLTDSRAAFEPPHKVVVTPTEF